MRLAIVGGRNFSDYRKLMAEADRVCAREKQDGGEVVAIVSGGARGADSLAERYAKDREIAFYCCPPLKEEIDTLGFARAAYARNQRIVDGSDYVLAFPDKKSRGTWDTVRKAYKKGIRVRVIE